jgi:hypothetical protein
MSDDNFIARWSRLKREAESEKSRPKRPVEHGVTPLAQNVGASHERGREGSDPATEVEPPFDPATLPPIESIVAGTDIRAFLQKGVPAELTKAALRRAWSTDPAIRDFIEIAENQWDFTDPSSIPGFGPLRAGDDVRQLAAQAMGRLSEAPQQPPGRVGEEQEQRRASVTETAQESRPAPASPEAAADPSKTDKPDDQDTPAYAALQHPDPASSHSRTPRRKGHGAAMPR